MILSMASRDEITDFLDQLLDTARFADYGPNGLQVPGAAEVRRVVTGVSATLELFEIAAERDAQMVLVHHGIFWGESGALSLQQANRLRSLLLNEINLVAYHLPLDAHPEHGNNALLCEQLGLAVTAPFGDFKGNAIGVLCDGEGASGVQIAERIERELGREPLHLAYGPSELERIAVISGAAPDSIHDAAAIGADAFITGEPAERVQANAKELCLDFFAAGHHATERLGVQRLGELLADRFAIEAEFVDIPNPI